MFERLTKLFAGDELNKTKMELHPAIHKIEYDMMLKGNIYERPSGNVRQCSVTVDGATQLVTSGDVVNQKVYDALIDFHAIAPVAPKEPQKNQKPKNPDTVSTNE